MVWFQYDRFLYDRDIRHERIKNESLKLRFFRYNENGTFIMA